MAKSSKTNYRDGDSYSRQAKLEGGGFFKQIAAAGKEMVLVAAQALLTATILAALEFWKENGIIKDEFTMCYAYGSYNNDTLDILKNNNCIVSLTTTTKTVELENYTPYELPRYDTNDFPQI